MSARWYVLYTKPRCERVVSERLRSKGFETYLPAVAVNRSGDTTTTRPFFPRYLFVRLDPNTDALSSVRWTRGLKHVVRFGEKPAVVPDEVIALIRDRLAATEAADDRERIGSGPFADPSTRSGHRLEAVFEQALKPAERAWGLMHFLDWVSGVQVEVEDLEPVGGGQDDC